MDWPKKLEKRPANLQPDMSKSQDFEPAGMLNNSETIQNLRVLRMTMSTLLYRGHTYEESSTFFAPRLRTIAMTVVVVVVL